ncbi:MAG TPA: hypothetical protein VJ397_08405 [Thermoplasmata archaeon]|nr:hypothetical protein [Thermoplasmata archaeon]
MATSVKMRDRDKRRLDRLQGELTLRRGRKLSRQELLSWLVSLGESEMERLLKDATRPMTEREIASMERLIVDTGVRTRETEIDRAVAEGTR